MKRNRIAILGSTSYIAKSIIPLLLEKGYDLTLISRSLGNLDLLEQYSFPWDVIINCIREQNVNGQSVSDLFFTTEKYDNLIIEYLKNNLETLYINFSSGAIYGNNFEESMPATDHSFSSINVNNIKPEDYYSINKLYLEAKHRSLFDLNIADIRIFSYFSRYSDLKVHHLIEQIIRSIKEDKEFITDSNNIVRDFIHPKDLVQLICCCINKEKINGAFDAFSIVPIIKSEILKFFTKVYNLKCKFINELDSVNVTGKKDIFYSCNFKALRELNYFPQYSSLDTIKEEVNYIFTNK